MENKEPKGFALSVLIPTKDGETTLPEVLAMLSLQTVEIDEILIADSGSTDATVNIAHKYGADVIHIDPLKFDHGGTRTLLSLRSKGDILIFLTQDAIPNKRDSLERLIQPMLEDSSITTCYGRQLPNIDADHFASSLRMFNYPDEPKVRSFEDRETLGLKTVFTSNSFACYRKKSLENIGFFKDGLIFGEDTIAVSRLLKNGDKIAYASDAMVYHSHNYRPIDEFKRYFDIGVLHSSEKWFLDIFGSAEGQGKKYIRHELEMLRKKKLILKLPELFWRVFLKYSGYKLGRNYKILPRQIILKLSLHGTWWKKAGN